MFVAVRDAAPARVGDDDRVGQRGQSVPDNGHLHRVARGEVPQDAYRCRESIKEDSSTFNYLKLLNSISSVDWIFL